MSKQDIEILTLDTGVVALPEANFYAEIAKTTQSVTD